MSLFDLTQLGDDALRAALFGALVERLSATTQQDPSIALVNQMPTVLSVSRRGNLLTLSQGLGPWLLRGDLKSKDRRERLKTFNVGRATIQSRLAITPDRFEGTPDEILGRIVAMFLEWTAAEEDGRRTAAERVHEDRSTTFPAERKRQPLSPPALPETRSAIQSERQAGRLESRVAPDRSMTPHGVPQERRTTPAISPQPKRTISAEPASPRQARIREAPLPASRTYELLFETARRELEQARTLPAGSRYFLIGSGVFVALTAEAFFNDLGSRVIPSWSQLQRLDPREKAEVLNIELFNDKVNWSTRPFRSVAEALGFRRALAHAHAETLSFDQVPAAHHETSEVPRTRRTAWSEHCEVATIQRWITDVRLVIEHFSRGYDPTEVAVGMANEPSATSKRRPTGAARIPASG